MHGDYAKSTLPKIWLTACHVVALMLMAWILFGGNVFTLFANVLSPQETQTSSVQRYAFFLCSIIYFGRLCVTEFLILRRSVGWEEAIGLSLLLLSLYPAFAILLLASDPISTITLLVSLALYGVGSFLNTYSELQRYRWKKRNPGALYTNGLFRWSVHINYFGDIVLFSGFALIVGSWLALIVPFLIAVLFAVYHVPKLDQYLAAKYGEDFRQWKAKTPKLIPFVYLRT